VKGRNTAHASGVIQGFCTGSIYPTLLFQFGYPRTDRQESAERRGRTATIKEDFSHVQLEALCAPPTAKPTIFRAFMYELRRRWCPRNDPHR